MAQKFTLWKWIDKVVIARRPRRRGNLGDLYSVMRSPRYARDDIWLNLIRPRVKVVVKKKRRKKSSEKIDWHKAPDLDKRVYELIRGCELEYVNKIRVFCYRSTNSKTRAYARIWGLNKLWQRTLEVEPAYILEVISEKFDRLSERERDMILVHELMHIPKNFSGALLPHRGGRMYEHRVREVYNRFASKTR